MPWPCCSRPRPSTPARIVQATSLGAEDMVLTDLIARHGLAIAVGHARHRQAARADAGPDRRASRQRYGLTRRASTRRAPKPWCTSCARTASDAMYHSIELRKACCAHAQAASRWRACWPAAAPGSPACAASSPDARGDVPLRRSSTTHGRVKFNPLADWTLGRRLALHRHSTTCPTTRCTTSSMPSIGCAPCTRAIAVGEDFRAGRWWWEDEAAKECGLHVSRARLRTRRQPKEPAHERPR